MIIYVMVNFPRKFDFSSLRKEVALQKQQISNYNIGCDHNIEHQ